MNGLDGLLAAQRMLQSKSAPGKLMGKQSMRGQAGGLNSRLTTVSRSEVDLSEYTMGDAYGKALAYALGQSKSVPGGLGIDVLRLKSCGLTGTGAASILQQLVPTTAIGSSSPLPDATLHSNPLAPPHAPSGEDGEGVQAESEVKPPPLVFATAEQLVKDQGVYVIRHHVLEEGAVQFPSKKKEGHWVIKFNSDGKAVPKPLGQIQVAAAAGDGKSCTPPVPPDENSGANGPLAMIDPRAEHVSAAEKLTDALSSRLGAAGTLTRLDLSHNKLGAELKSNFGEVMATLLSTGYMTSETDGCSVPSSITRLDLQNNDLSDRLCKQLVLGLHANYEHSKLRWLNLSSNKAGSGAAGALAQMLRKNRTLTSLGLASNSILGKPAAALALSLAYNPTLLSLDISCNGFHDEQAVEALGIALGGNVWAELVETKKAGKKKANEKARKKADAKDEKKAFMYKSKEELAKEAVEKRKQRALEKEAEAEAASELAARVPSGLTHLDLSHNQLDAGKVQLLAEALEHNQRLLGLHFEGNAGFMNSLGRLVPKWTMTDGGEHASDQSKVGAVVASTQQGVTAQHFMTRCMQQHMGHMSGFPCGRVLSYPESLSSPIFLRERAQQRRHQTSCPGHQQVDELERRPGTENLMTKKAYTLSHSKGKNKGNGVRLTATEEFQSLGMAEYHASCCWLCGGWAEQSIRWVPSLSGPRALTMTKDQRDEETRLGKGTRRRSVTIGGDKEDGKRFSQEQIRRASVNARKTYAERRKGSNAEGMQAAMRAASQEVVAEEAPLLTDMSAAREEAKQKRNRTSSHVQQEDSTKLAPLKKQKAEAAAAEAKEAAEVTRKEEVTAAKQRLENAWWWTGLFEEQANKAVGIGAPKAAKKSPEKKGKERKSRKAAPTEATVTPSGSHGLSPTEIIASMGRELSACAIYKDEEPPPKKPLDEETAATKIQARIRDRSARKQVDEVQVVAMGKGKGNCNKSNKTLEETKQHEDIAATKLQAQVRGRSTRTTRGKGKGKGLKKEKTNGLKKGKKKKRKLDQDSAATKLQAQIRGRNARKAKGHGEANNVKGKVAPKKAPVLKFGWKRFEVDLLTRRQLRSLILKCYQDKLEADEVDRERAARALRRASNAVSMKQRLGSISNPKAVRAEDVAVAPATSPIQDMRAFLGEWMKQQHGGQAANKKLRVLLLSVAACAAVHPEDGWVTLFARFCCLSADKREWLPHGQPLEAVLHSMLGHVLSHRRELVYNELDRHEQRAVAEAAVWLDRSAGYYYTGNGCLALMGYKKSIAWLEGALKEEQMVEPEQSERLLGVIAEEKVAVKVRAEVLYKHMTMVKKQRLVVAPAGRNGAVVLPEGGTFSATAVKEDEHKNAFVSVEGCFVAFASAWAEELALRLEESAKPAEPEPEPESDWVSPDGEWLGVHVALHLSCDGFAPTPMVREEPSFGCDSPWVSHRMLPPGEVTYFFSFHQPPRDPQTREEREAELRELEEAERKEEAYEKALEHLAHDQAVQAAEKSLHMSHSEFVRRSSRSVSISEAGLRAGESSSPAKGHGKNLLNSPKHKNKSPKKLKKVRKQLLKAVAHAASIALQAAAAMRYVKRAAKMALTSVGRLLPTTVAMATNHGKSRVLLHQTMVEYAFARGVESKPAVNDTTHFSPDQDGGTGRAAALFSEAALARAHASEVAAKLEILQESNKRMLSDAAVDVTMCIHHLNSILAQSHKQHSGHWRDHPAHKVAKHGAGGSSKEVFSEHLNWHVSQAQRRAHLYDFSTPPNTVNLHHGRRKSMSAAERAAAEAAEAAKRDEEGRLEEIARIEEEEQKRQAEEQKSKELSRALMMCAHFAHAAAQHAESQHHIAQEALEWAAMAAAVEAEHRMAQELVNSIATLAMAQEELRLAEAEAERLSKKEGKTFRAKRLWHRGFNLVKWPPLNKVDVAARCRAVPTAMSGDINGIALPTASPSTAGANEQDRKAYPRMVKEWTLHNCTRQLGHQSRFFSKQSPQRNVQT
jgi:hypothetical protein